MKLQISNNAKVNNKKRTAMSQQSLVNALLSEKQAVQPNNSQPQPQSIPPVQNWGGK